MDKPIQLFRFTLSWFVTFIIAVCVLVHLLFGDRDKVWRYWVRTWSRTILKILKVELKVTGEENLVGPAIVAMNHESILDIFVSPLVAPGFATFLAKKEVGRIPLVGRAMAACGCIFVDRKNTERAKNSIKEGLKQLPCDASILIYPEGTRSRNYELQKLKKGICHIALQTKLPILPVGQHGMINIAGGRQELFFKPGTLYVHVGEKIVTKEWKTETIDKHREELSSAMKKAISKAKEEMKKKDYSASEK